MTAATPLVGRRDEVAVLLAVLDDSASGHVNVAVVEGEAGIGKSRLALEITSVAAARGYQVLVGRADEIDRVRPLGPLLDAVDGLATGPGLGPSASEYEQREHLIGRVEHAVADGVTVLVLEDVQWADPATISILPLFGRRLEGLPLLVVVTARPLPRDRALERVLQRLDCTHIVLGPLPETDAIGLLGADVVEDAPALVRRAGGNPFFILELARTLHQAGGGGLLPDLAQAAQRRLADLTPETENVVRVASVLGSTFTLSDLAMVCDRAPASLLPAVSEAMRAGLLGEQEDRLVFRHDLVRDAAYESVPRSARPALHRDAAHALARAGAPAGKVAAQLRLAAQPGDDEAISWLQKAAAEVNATPTLAAETLEQALALTLPRDARRPGIAHDLAAALSAAGRLAEAETTCRDALVEVVDRSETASLHVRLLHALVFNGRGQDALTEAATARESVDDVEQRALIDAYAAMARVFVAEMALAVEEAQAVVDGPAAPDGVARCFAEIVLSVALRLQGFAADALEHADRAVALAHQSKADELARLDPQHFRVMCLIDVARLDDCATAIEAGRASAEHLGLAWNLPGYHYLAAHRRFLLGEWDDAVAELEAGLVLDADVSSPDLPGALAFDAQLRVLRGDLAGAATALDASDQARTAAGSLMGSDQAAAAQAMLSDAHGRPDAFVGLDQVWTLLTMVGIAGNRPFVAADLVRAALAAGDDGRAATISADMATLAAGARSRLYAAAAQHCEGLVAHDAEQLLGAADAFGATGVKVLEARAAEDAGEAIGRTAPTKARDALERALVFYDHVGSARDAARVNATMRSLGIRRGARGPRHRPTTGWDSLTPTELAVVALITDGLTTSQIAARLYVSPHTVATHVKHIFAKLGLSSRVELAAIGAGHRQDR